MAFHEFAGATKGPNKGKCPVPLNQAQVQAGTRVKSTAATAAEWGLDSLDESHSPGMG